MGLLENNRKKNLTNEIISILIKNKRVKKITRVYPIRIEVNTDVSSFPVYLVFFPSEF